MDIENIRDALNKEPDDAVSELLGDVEEHYGEVPYILDFMKDMPDLLISKMLYDNSIMREFKRIDPKTVELISIAVASALRCEHCLKMHLKVANRLGITKEEIFDSVLIAGTLSNAAVLAEGTRAIDHELNGYDECGEDCDICKFSPDEND